MLFIHITTSLLAIVALLSLRNNFGDSRLLVAFVLIGFAISWWQQKRSKNIPHLKIILNILLVLLVIKAFLPFFTTSGSDILSGLIKTWIYFLIASSFTVSSKRDYYAIHVLSLGLIIFSCFSQTASAMAALSFIIAFFIIWIIALREMSFSKDSEYTYQATQTKDWFYRELKIGLTFMLIVIIVTIPVYLMIPHLKIPLPFPRLVEQKYAITYADFPRSSILSFLGPSPKKLTKKGYGKNGVAVTDKGLEMHLNGFKARGGRLIFWHSHEECENALERLKVKVNQTRAEIVKKDKGLKELSWKENIPQLKTLIEERKRLTHRKEELTHNIENLEKHKDFLKEGYFKAIQEKSIAYINEPENNELLARLDEEVQALAKDLENMVNTLRLFREESNKIDFKIGEIRFAVFHHSRKSSVANRIQKMWDEKWSLEGELKSLEKGLVQLQDDCTYLMATQSDKGDIEKKEKIVKKEDKGPKDKQGIPPKKDKVALFGLSTRFFTLIALLTVLFLLIYCIIIFFLPYLRQRNKFKRALINNKYNQAIILLYNLLCRILNIFGYKYPVVIDPEEYSINVSRRFTILRSDCNQITTLFLEARYSSHKIIKEQVQKAVLSYKSILKKLKTEGSFWQRLVLRAGTVFNL